MKVGDFVRFKHEIATANGGILSREKAVVVGIDGPIARIVWSDGEASKVALTKLRRTEGKVGKAIGEKKCPIKDRGIKPHLAPPRVVPAPLPVTNGCWAVVDQHEVKGFVTEPKNPGDNPGFMRFAIPLKVVEVRNTIWPKGHVLKLSRSHSAVTVTFPNGEKKSMTLSGAREWMVGRFGQEMGDTLARMTDVQAHQTPALPVSKQEGITTKVNCPVDYSPDAYSMGNRKVDTSPIFPDSEMTYAQKAKVAHEAHARYAADLDVMMAAIA